MYDILYYNDLNNIGLEKKFNKVVSFLKNGDFKSAEVKKLSPSRYLRAKLDDSNRLIFTPLTHQDKTYLVILEVVRNHEYEKSRFLRGVTEIHESEVQFLQRDAYNSNDVTHNLETSSQLAIAPQNRPVHFLDKFLVFDDDQTPIINCNLPLILIGSAGSGKTSLMLEKLKTLDGNVLYISLSSYLVHNTHQLYYNQHYENDKQEVDFLSFHEFLETIKIPDGREVTVHDFLIWFNRQTKPKFLHDGRKLFEEFRGVITGANTSTIYLTYNEYINLGIKQSIYLETERKEVYQLFTKYLSFLKENKLYDSNLIAFEYTVLVTKRYDAVLIDEVQDFTNSQLSLVLKTLNNSNKFFLCGDANQIVHPNFFSWSKLKSYFYTNNNLESVEITRILTKNYRNTPEVIELANRVLKLKNYKFGSIDKESHVLIQSTINSHGAVSCIDAKSKLVNELNSKTSKSIKYAVLVLHENDKARAKLMLNTPLIFTPQEAKGLEYENVILFDFVSNEPKFAEIARGVNDNYLVVDFTYARTKEKSDKSLEIYKFYVNALYVVITRATKNIYLIENNPNHQFLRLLNINEIEQIEITEDKSSLEDWAIEANKLAKQGKMEQMHAIEEQILQYAKVPWEIITQEVYSALKQHLTT
ncbi:MAG: UvrD-helicase domain-containing protein, partial [Neisseriaceae bacterium]